MSVFTSIVVCLTLVVLCFGIGDLAKIVYECVKPIYPKCPHCDNKYKQHIPVRQYDQVTGEYTCETCGKVSYWLDIWIYQLR